MNVTLRNQENQAIYANYKGLMAANCNQFQKTYLMSVKFACILTWRTLHECTWQHGFAITHASIYLDVRKWLSLSCIHYFHVISSVHSKLLSFWIPDRRSTARLKFSQTHCIVGLEHKLVHTLRDIMANQRALWRAYFCSQNSDNAD